MNQQEKALTFAALHRKGNPVILYNAWDAGSAGAVAKAGAKAIATGSMSVAAARGFADGENIPLDFVCTVASRIAATVDLPVTVDFEGGYARAHDRLAANVSRLIGTGIVGINFEDQIVGDAGIYCAEEQAARIAAVRAAAEKAGIALFINARTDFFLKEKDKGNHAALLDEGIRRAKAYAEAGASGFFAPGLTDEGLIGALCAASPIPVNIMMYGAPPLSRLAELGVARASYGPIPYFTAMQQIEDAARAVFAG